MYALYLQFKSAGKDLWLAVHNKDHDALHWSQTFALTQELGKAHVFYEIEDLLEIKAHITRVLNRRSENEEPFDESREHTGEIVKVIREYLNAPERWTIEFDLRELVPKSMGKAAFAIRSDVL